MANRARLKIEITVEDENGLAVNYAPQVISWTPGVVKRESVSLTGSAFTALSPPSGAKALLIDLGAAVSLTLKGVTGDTGIALEPASASLALPLFFPLGSSPSIGIANGSASTQTVICYWW